MQEWIERLSRAKAIIDNGMCRVGPALDRSKRSDGLLAGGASRSLSLADAIVQLCRHNHANEALPLLRHLAETSAAMLWLTSGDSVERGRALEDELRAPQWEGLWPSQRFLDRLKNGVIAKPEAEALLGFCYDFVRGGSAVVPWSHLFKENQHSGIDAEKVLHLAAKWMGRVLQALEARWPGAFPGGEALAD